MANVPESPTWEAGIYQFETTDPVQGGPDGIDNLPNKQLANRTAYLKQNLEALQQSVDAVGVEGQNALWIAVEQAISFAGLLEQELHRQQTVRHQEGEFVLQNRGVIRGCSLSRSTTANRNLNIASGAVFMLGREWGVAGEDNAAAVPSNSGSQTATATAYLIDAGSGLVLAVTGLNEAPPEGAMALATLTIPAGNNGTNDPYLDNVSITTVARTEPDWPWVQSSPVYRQQDLPRLMGGDGYHLDLDVVSYDGGQPPTLAAAAADRARNTFRAYLRGTADNVRVRFVAHLMDQ
jgi:hypothetical protein